MTPHQEGSPSLREALLRLERGRAREAALRRDSEAMLGAIHLVARGGSPEQLFRRLTHHFRPIVGFEWASLLRRGSAGDWVVCNEIQPTHPDLRLEDSSAFHRALQGETIVAFDAKALSGLSDIETQLRLPVGSALIYALEFDGHPILCICLHSERGRFSREHTELVQKFRPLLNQALSVASAELARGEVLQLKSQSREYTKQIQLLESGTSAIGVGLMTWDGHGSPRNPSETLVRMISPWESLDAWWRQVIDAYGVNRVIQDVSSGSKVVIELASPDGTERAYSVACVSPGPFTKESDLPLLVTDRTKQVREEEDRVRAEERFRNLFHSSADGVIVLDTEGQVLDLNQKASQLLQLKKSADNLSWAALHAEHSAQEARDAIAKTRLDQEQSYRADLLGADDSTFTAEVLLKKIHVGRETLIQGIFRDVTEQQQAQLRLKQSEARKSAVLHAALDCIISIDENGLIIEFNPAAESTLGWTKDEVIGRRMSEFFIPLEHRADHDAGLKHFIKTGQANVLGRRLELPAVTKNGRIILTEAAITQTIGLDGRPMFTGFLRDITEQKAAQVALQEAKDEAEAASTAKSDFLASMSHELRTPLHVIAGMTELARDQHEQEDVSELLEVIDSSTRSLLALIDDLLDVSRIEAGRLPIQVEDVDMLALLDELRSMFAFRAEQKALALDWQVDAALPPVMRTDPARLRQILINLLSNAIKFTETGRVTLQAQALAEGTRTVLRIRVRDTGPGFDRAQRDKLFERFEQLGREEHGLRESGGMGLGLAISHGLAELMGGRLSGDSALGKGSVFTVELPIELGSLEAERRAPAPAPQPAQTTPSWRILVVDDHPDNRLLAERILSRAGHEVALAQDGQEALATAQEFQPDLVLMDVEMPDWNGFETTQAFRDTHSLASTPIVALTAHAVHGFRERCLAAGMNDYLAKPFGMEQLLAKVREVQGSQASAPASSIAPEAEVEVDEDVIDLIPDYLARSAVMATEAQNATQRGRFEEVREIAHKLKGSGSSFGLDRITELGNDLHAAAVAAIPESALEACEELQTYLANVRVQARKASSK